LASRVLAVGFVGLLGALTVPSCVIRIGPGGDEGDQTGGTSDNGETTRGDSTGETPPEELPTEEPSIADADPVEVARVTAIASYAAVQTSNLVQAQVADPATVDPAVLEELVYEYAPVASEEALAVIDATDPSLISTGFYPDFTCIQEPYACPVYTKCPWLAPGGATCTVTSCGKGSCPICPAIFGNLLFQGWCAYGCMKGDKVVGGAFMMHTVGKVIGPICIPN
jgi:hypothetical protein